MYNTPTKQTLMQIKKKKRKLFLDILRVCVPIIMLGWLISTVDWFRVIPLFQEIPWWMLGGALITFSLSQVVIAIRWYYLLYVIGMRSSFTLLLDLVFIGSFASNFLPTTIGGDAVKMVGISREQPKRAMAVASVVADRMFNLVGMIFILPIALALPNIQTHLFGEGRQMTLHSAFFMTLWDKNKKRIQLIWNPISLWFTSGQTILISLTLSWISIALAFASFWIVVYAVGIRISFLQASAIAELSYFVALLPLAINGLGILESSETYLLTLHGATLEQAVAAAFLIRLVTIFVSLIGGFRLVLGWKNLLAASKKEILDN
jgi:glycosyltransferase 2 family protein